MAKRGKKYLEALKLVDRSKRYSLDEAVELVKKTNVAKFDATVEVSFKLNIDPRKAEQNLRGAVSLPNGTGKAVRVLVIAKGAKAQEAIEFYTSATTSFLTEHTDNERSKSSKTVENLEKSSSCPAINASKSIQSSSVVLLFDG